MRLQITMLALFVVLSGISCSADDANNAPPQVVLNVGNDVRLEVGETLKIDITANDPEGSCNKFSYKASPKGSTSTASLLDDGCTVASFQWAPIASDVTQDEPMRLIFIVTDEASKTTEKTVNLTIVPGNGVPRFLNNASELYDPRSNQPVRISVSVRDDDSNEVELRIDDGPTGSTFDQTGKFTGEFEWTPTVEQLKKRVHSATFVAQDNQNEIKFKVTIVIRSSTGGELKPDSTSLACPGEEVISHEPLGVQRSTADYEVAASLEPGAAGRYDEMYLYWTLGDPYNEGSQDDKDAFEAIKLVDDGSGTFRGSIGNQASIIATGSALDISYTICAIDRDSSDENAVVCVPSTGDFSLYHSFTAYLPDETEACIDDGNDTFGAGNDTFDTATTLSADSYGFFRTCDENEDFHALLVRPGESYLVAAIYSADQGIVVEAFDNNRSSIDIGTSDCTGLSGLQVSVPENGTAQSFYLKVTGPAGASYQTRAIKLQGGAGGCSDDAIEPNDDALSAAPAASGDSIAAEICDPSDIDVYAIDMGVGDTITVVHKFTNALGNLDLTLFKPSQASIVALANINDGPAFTFGIDQDEETLTYTAVEAGTHYLLVFNNNETANAYTLDFAINQAPACPDDDMFSIGAGNHTQDDAGLLSAPADGFLELKGLSVCPGKPDWYQRTEFNLASVLGELRVVGGGSLSDVSLEVIDLQGNVLVTGTPDATNAYLEFDFPPASTAPVFYKVSASTRLTYELDLLR